MLYVQCINLLDDDSPEHTHVEEFSPKWQHYKFLNDESYERLIKCQPVKHNTKSAWLNDEVVNAYFNLLQVSEMEGTVAGAHPSGIFSNDHRVFFASSYLLDKLIFHSKPDVETEYSSRVLGPYNLDNILDVRYILLPACHSSHWTLFVVDLEDRVVHYFDSLFSSTKEQVARSYCTSVIEWMKRVHTQGNRPWTADWNTMIHKSIPQQHNVWDCGVFVLAYANHLAFKGLSISSDSFSQSDLPSFRQQLTRQLKLREIASLEVSTGSHSESGCRTAFCSFLTVICFFPGVTFSGVCEDT